MAQLDRDHEAKPPSKEEGQIEHEFANFFRLSLDMLCIAGGDGYFKQVNPAFGRTLGYPERQLLDCPFIDFVHPDDRTATEEALRKLNEGVPAICFENRYRCMDGTYRWLSWTAVPQRGGNHIYAIASDVSGRKRAEAELTAGEQRYRELLAAVTSYTYSVEIRDGEYQSTVHNAGCMSTTGYTPADFAADPFLWIRMVHPDDGNLVREHAARAMAGNGESSIEHRILHQNGTIRWVRHKIIAHRDADGRVMRSDGIVEDITERKTIEERFRLLIESAPDAMVVVDTNGTIVLVNARAERLFGYRRDELLGEPVALLIPQSLRAAHAAECAGYIAKPVPRNMGARPSLRCLRKDGSQFPAEIALSPIETDAGLLVYAAIRDLTERMQLEHSLREQMSQLLAARRIQEHLLPECAPSLPGFDIAGAVFPAQFAAGDHFDFLAMPDSCVGVVVADVAGHGVGPAILVASTHAYLHLLAAGSTDVASILAQANRVVCAETDSDFFITAFFACLDPGARRLTYASAGHTTATIFDAAGKVRASLTSTSFPLGILPDAQFHAGTPVVLAPGDIMLAFTDGLLEATSREDEPFGIQRVEAVVAREMNRTAAEIIRCMHESLTAFAGSTNLNDDVTMVVLKVDKASRPWLFHHR